VVIREPAVIFGPFPQRDRDTRQIATGLAATVLYFGGNAYVMLTECLAFQGLPPRRMQRNIKFHQADGDEIQAVDTTGGAL